MWLSETMLQQTRVEAVIPYYERFLARFPTVRSLAEAPQPEVLALWSGLGYYSRARNLHKAAKHISEQGTPRTHETLRALPGVGPYTAAAVASIALGLPHAAVDGNVLRVLSRLTADAGEISSPATRRRISAAADELLDRRRPGDFNQAMMELGATVCLPKNPSCAACPVGRFCAARAAGVERQLPVKRRKAETRETGLALLVLTQAENILLVQKPASARRLAGFWELPEKRLLGKLRSREAAAFTHQIVNDRFRVTVWISSAASPKTGLKTEHPPEARWIPFAELSAIPVTTVTKKALQAMGFASRIPPPFQGI